MTSSTIIIRSAFGDVFLKASDVEYDIVKNWIKGMRLSIDFDRTRYPSIPSALKYSIKTNYAVEIDGHRVGRALDIHSGVNGRFFIFLDLPKQVDKDEDS